MYIADLLKRLASTEWPPGALSSRDTISFQAHTEVHALSDLSHLEELRAVVKKAKKQQDIIGLASVICYLYQNTGSEEVRGLYPDLCRKEKLGSVCVMYLLDYATRAKFVEILPFARKWLEWHPRVDNHYHECLRFLAMALGKAALHELGSHLDNDCFGRDDPIHCIDALEGLNDPAAIPYFQKFVERHKKGRKGWEQDGVHFCMKAIENLSRHAEPDAAPNGGPAAPVPDSGANEGPPSVS